MHARISADAAPNAGDQDLDTVWRSACVAGMLQWSLCPAAKQKTPTSDRIQGANRARHKSFSSHLVSTGNSWKTFSKFSSLEDPL